MSIRKASSTRDRAQINLTIGEVLTEEREMLRVERLDILDPSAARNLPGQDAILFRSAGPEREWAKLHVDHVQQAHLGAGLDILVGGSGDGSGAIRIETTGGVSAASLPQAHDENAGPATGNSMRRSA
ncbi:MAG TPA: hypothetical protein VN017_02810 [Pseudoxanthomonas sp.]|nr:hypothetical protein [Pseudoxanthomonas sp.]